MRLYTLTGATQVDDPQHGTFTAGPDGSFDFPNELSDRLHPFPGWEDDAERAARLAAEELERLRDPATLARLLQESLTGAPSAPSTPAGPLVGESAPVSKAPADTPAPAAKRAARRPATGK